MKRSEEIQFISELYLVIKSSIEKRDANKVSSFLFYTGWWMKVSSLFVVPTVFHYFLPPVSTLLLMSSTWPNNRVQGHCIGFIPLNFNCNALLDIFVKSIPFMWSDNCDYLSSIYVKF